MFDKKQDASHRNILCDTVFLSLAAKDSENGAKGENLYE
jgi:hypothetical protein